MQSNFIAQELQGLCGLLEVATANLGNKGSTTTSILRQSAYHVLSAQDFKP